MQELMVVVDTGITDYSSWIYDYVNTRKLVFIYATNIDAYMEYTGLCYPLTSTPFPVCQDNEELFSTIDNIDMKKYKVLCDEFLDDKESVDDGHSSYRIAHRILELMDLE